MPTVTPRATFMVDDRWFLNCSMLDFPAPIHQPSATSVSNRQSKPATSSVLAQHLVKRLAGLLGGAPGLWDFPLHLARPDFILRNAAGLAGIGVDHRRGARLQLARPPRRHQNVAVVAVEAFNHLHGGSPLKSGLEPGQWRASHSSPSRTTLNFGYVPYLSLSRSGRPLSTTAAMIPRNPRARGFPKSS